MRKWYGLIIVLGLFFTSVGTSKALNNNSCITTNSYDPCEAVRKNVYDLYRSLHKSDAEANAAANKAQASCERNQNLKK